MNKHGNVKSTTTGSLLSLDDYCFVRPDPHFNCWGQFVISHLENIDIETSFKLVEQFTLEMFTKGLVTLKVILMRSGTTWFKLWCFNETQILRFCLDGVMQRRSDFGNAQILCCHVLDILSSMCYLFGVYIDYVADDHRWVCWIISS